MVTPPLRSAAVGGFARQPEKVGDRLIEPSDFARKRARNFGDIVSARPLSFATALTTTALLMTAAFACVLVRVNEGNAAPASAKLGVFFDDFDKFIKICEKHVSHIGVKPDAASLRDEVARVVERNGLLVGRREINVSNTSASATNRAETGMVSPASPSG